MSPEQEGAYIRLLCFDWDADGLPDDDAALARLSRLGEGWLKGGSLLLRQCFQPHPAKPGFITNPRLAKEREKQRLWKEKSSEGGIKSVESRRSKRFKGGSQMVQTNGQPKVNSPSPSLSLSSSSSSSSSLTPTTISSLPSTTVPPLPNAADAALWQFKARVAGWYRRRDGTAWDAKEMKALRSVFATNPTAEDIALVEKFVTSPGTFHRKDIQTLLNNWNQELDRARNHDYEPRPQNTGPGNGNGFNRPQTGAEQRKCGDGGVDYPAIQRRREAARLAEEQAARDRLAAKVAGHGGQPANPELRLSDPSVGGAVPTT